MPVRRQIIVVLACIQPIIWFSKQFAKPFPDKQISFQINYSVKILITNINMETMNESEPPLALVR